MGNLADELDFLSDEEEYDEGNTEDALESADKQHGSQEQDDTAEGARDSGIDVSYNSKRSSPKHVRNFSKPFSDKPPDENEEDDLEERLSPELLAVGICGRCVYWCDEVPYGRERRRGRHIVWW